MKKFSVLAILVGVLMFGVAGIATATSTTFNFNGSISNLDSYMSGIFGDPNSVNTDNLQLHDVNGSQGIRTDNHSYGTIDFDPCDGGACIRLTSVSFDWTVFDATSGIDFGLDVYDENYNSNGHWRTNVFSVNLGETSQFSGLISFDSAWHVTRLKIHDNNEHDVGIDNLNVNWDNCNNAVPEPTTMLLLGFGLVGLTGIRRKFNS